MAKKVTSKKSNAIGAENPVWVNVIAFSMLMVIGGSLCLQGSVSFGAASFALAAVFSSISTPWTNLPALARMLITVSTVFGVGALIVTIIF